MPDTQTQTLTLSPEVADVAPAGSSTSTGDGPPDILAFARRAQALWRDHTALRAKQADILGVLHNEHAVPYPKLLENRLVVVKTGVCAEKLDHAVSVLNDREGLTWTVSQAGDSQPAAAHKEIVQQWLQGGWREAEVRGGGSLRADITQNVLVHSYVAVVVLPDMAAWGSLPGRNATGAVADAIGDPDAAERVLGALKREQEAHKRARWPITERVVDARCTIAEAGLMGRPSDIWLYETYAVGEVLASWVDEHGAPRATKLAQQVTGQASASGSGLFSGVRRLVRELFGPADVTQASTVTVVTHLDARTVTQAVLSSSYFPEVLEDAGEDVRDFSPTDEIIHHAAHGMGRVPVAFFTGRTRPSRDPVKRWYGFLDVVYQTAVALDAAKTQRATVARSVAYQQLVLKQAVDGPGGGDAPKEITLTEGGVTVLDAGDELVNPNQTNAQDMRVLQEHISDLERQIDKHTFGAYAQGVAAADSGYQLAQLMAANETVLEPFADGLQDGYEDCARLRILAARAVMEETGIDGIPVRYVSDENVKWITLTKKMAEDDWDIAADLRTRPVGGEMALIQTEKLKYESGITSLREFMIACGNRNPERTIRWRRREALEQTQEAQSAFGAEVAARFLAAVRATPVPQGPNEPLIPEALASILNPNGLAAQRLPEGYQPGANLGPTAAAPTGVGGLPNMAAWSPPSGPPTPSEGTRLSSLGLTGQPVPGGGGLGPPAGMGQATPGGGVRQSNVAAGRGF